jgi:predicted PurR-regulated permease PerM
MDANRDSSRDTSHMDKAMDVAIRLSFVGLVVLWCSKIISPFFIPLLWGVIISVALYPVFLKLKGWLGGRNNLAGALFILVSLALILVPTILLTDSIIGGATGLKDGLEEGTLKVPHPSESVKEWPAIGPKVYDAWAQFSRNLGSEAAKYSDQLKGLAGWMAGSIAGLGAAVIQTIFALIIAGVLMMHAMGGGRVANGIAYRLGGSKAQELVTVSISTIRSVVRGVLLVAMIQGLMAAAGLVFAGVGGAGFWAVLVMIVAIMQLPPIIILGPIAAYVFSANDSTVVAVIFLIWSLVVSGADGVLKPIFLGRGVAVPMIVILVGAIGGMVVSGIIGLFVGAVILSLGYKLGELWLGDSLKHDVPAVSDEPASES